MKITILSNTNSPFIVTHYKDCSLLVEMSDLNQDVPLPFDDTTIILFMKFRYIFKKRKHLFNSRFQTLSDTEQQSLIVISNFIGNSSLTTYILNLYYIHIYYQVIPKCFITI
jgi:hypothetical protein